MTIKISEVANNQSFGVLKSRQDQLAQLMSQNVVTADSSSNGSVTTGNTNHQGVFGANTMAILTALRGGSVAVSANLVVASNTLVNNVASFLSNSTTSSITLNPNNVTIAPVSNTRITGNNFNVNTAFMSVNASASFAANIVFNTSAAALIFSVTSNSTVKAITANADISASGNVNITKNLTVTGNAVFTGTVTMQSNAGISFGSNVAANNLTSNSVNTGILTVSGNSNLGLIISNNVAQHTAFSYTVSNTSTQVLDSLPVASVRSSEYLIQASDNSTNSYHTTKILVIHDGTTAISTEYGSLFTNNNLGSFSASISGGNIRLSMTPAVSSMTLNVMRSSLVV